MFSAPSAVIVTPKKIINTLAPSVGLNSKITPNTPETAASKSVAHHVPMPNRFASNVMRILKRESVSTKTPSAVHMKRTECCG